jgi:hypothetical protein
MSDTMIRALSRFKLLAHGRTRYRRAIRSAHLDDFLLELILIDTLTVADPTREAISERLIHRVIPRHVYPRVMDRFDDLSRDADDDADVLAEWLPRAAAKDNRWKAKMIRWFVLIVGGGRRLSTNQLIEIAQLAAAMGAAAHCQHLFRAVFDFDPYNRPAARRTRPHKRNPLLFGEESLPG